MNGYGEDKRSTPHTNHKLFNPKLTWSHLLTTIALAIGGFMFVSDISSATKANASEIEHAKELQQQQNNHVSEELKEIKDILKEMRDKQ